MKQFFLPVLLAAIFLTSCSKEDYLKHPSTPTPSDQGSDDKPPTNAGTPYDWYRYLNPATLRQLQEARAATTRYQNLDKALADGYVDIEVDVEHMGHHYMNNALVDENFDIRKPEILVYNRLEDGTPVLVAVEYAVPIALARPEGFQGSADVWNGTSPFPLWLLHAWVWAYNPEGVFNWTNPLVHLH